MDDLMKLIEPISTSLRIQPDHVICHHFCSREDGSCEGYEHSLPTCKSHGKVFVIKSYCYSQIIH